MYCRCIEQRDDIVFQILKPSEKKAKYQYGGVNSGRPVTPPRTAQAPKKRWAAGLTLLLLPRLVSGTTSLQAASDTPAFSQSACSCVNRNSRSDFCLFCGYFYEHVNGFFHFFSDAMVCIYSAHSGILTPTSCGMGKKLLYLPWNYSFLLWICECMHACVTGMSSSPNRCKIQIVPTYGIKPFQFHFDSHLCIG